MSLGLNPSLYIIPKLFVCCLQCCAFHFPQEVTNTTGLKFGVLNPDHLWKMIRFWSWSVDFPHFGPILTWVKQVKFRGSSSFRMNGRNGLKFDVLMYANYLRAWLHFWSWSVDFPILVEFWLNETGQICRFWAFLLRINGRNELKFGMLIYPDHLRSWLDYGHGLLIFLIVVMTTPCFHANLTGLSQLKVHPSIHIHFRLSCSPCPILWGWQHQAILHTGSPCISVKWVSAS